MSDIMDDFEFKPLTEGLGFHKKEVQPATPTPIATSFRELSTPLPRPETSNLERPPKTAPKIPTDPSTFPTTTVDEILKTLQQKKHPDFISTGKKTKIDSTPEPARYKPSTFDLSAFLLDAMLVVAATLLCLIILLVNTKIDLFANLFNPESDRMIFVSLAALITGAAWIYQVTLRVFVGQTAGEWIFDQRLGRPEEANSGLYSLQAILRSTLVVLTGFVLFPIVSFVLNQDFLGRWLGLELMKKT